MIDSRRVSSSDLGDGSYSVLDILNTPTDLRMIDKYCFQIADLNISRIDTLKTRHIYFVMIVPTMLLLFGIVPSPCPMESP